MSTAAESALQTKTIPMPPRNSPGVRAGFRSATLIAAHPLIAAQCLALVLALIAAAECHSITIQSYPGYPILPSLLYGCILWCWWGIAAAVLWKFAERSGKDFFSSSSAAKHIGVGVFVAAAHVVVLQGFLDWSRQEWPVPGQATYGYLNFNRFLFELLLFGFIFGLTGVIHLQLASQRDKVRTLSLERELSAAHLRALQVQIEPHFLFNTLNAITSLVEQDRNEQALRTLQNLNSILRTTLRRSTPEKVSLAQELQLIDDYLSIEVTRFTDRLQVDMSIEPTSLDAQLPCFLLQPIVENAIRHGVSRSEHNSFIELRAESKDARLRLLVRNTAPIQAGPIEAGHGIGLKNTRERLALFYGNNYEFRTGTLACGSFEVSIDIPYERGRE
jgi:Histidine kinase